MNKVRICKNGEDVLISVEQYVNDYCKEPPEGWYQYIQDCVDRGMSIDNQDDYASYLKRMNLKSFDYNSVEKLYRSLKNSKYHQMFEDDILKYVAHIYGVGYFNRINYPLDISNPDIDAWLNTRNLFKPNRDKIPNNEGFSLNDLVGMKNGGNAIRKELIFSSKW